MNWKDRVLIAGGAESFGAKLQKTLEEKQPQRAIVFSREKLK